MELNRYYLEYQIPPNLQEHMLRVTALAQIITDNWQGSPIDKIAIIQVCALHDIAKPMMFDLAKQAQYGMSEKDIKKLRQLQMLLKTNYGEDEHQATIRICEKIGCSPKALKLVKNLEWSFIPRLLEDMDLESLIPIYCDMRIGISGILSLKERIDDLKRRTGEDKDRISENGQELESLLQKNVGINLNTISDDQINGRFGNLLRMSFG